MILELARDTSRPFVEHGATRAWSAFPTAGRSILLQALESGTILQFGQVMVNGSRAWHRDNAADDNVFSSPAALRTFVREDPFRPLATSANLPAGWHVDLNYPEDAHGVIETIYPGLIADWAAQKRGKLQTESLTDIGTRQNGMFKDIQLLPAKRDQDDAGQDLRKLHPSTDLVARYMPGS